ncbi:hypothetical protein U9M48_042876 [Paspalum notatum var. saurae]|uniref:Integrase catalytic domain-containing protein n=1 Tax=Paspalum notatum var. saurae TaxID=547442 RepID=A0AAQ3UTR3_PASNO
MKIKLEAKCLWGAIDPGGTAVERHEDRMALDAICSAVPPEMISTLAVKESVEDAWESIRVMRIGDDRVRKTSAQRVRRQYEELAFRDGEGIEDFALRLTGIVSQLATLGDPEAPAKVVEKYLRIARGRYKQLVVSIETLLDVSTLTVEEVTGRLLASEDDPEPTPPPAPAGGKLYLTEERWAGAVQAKEGENARTGGGSAGAANAAPQRGKDAAAGTRRRVRGPARRRAAMATPPLPRQTRPPGQGVPEPEEGPARPGKVEQAHVAQDDEPALLLVHDAVIAADPPSPPPPASARALDAHPVLPNPAPATSPRPTREDVHLVEGKVYAALDDEERRDPQRWIFDTGASNHMTGCRDAFSDPDTGITGTVRFGDGSVVRIEGCGTILFDRKNGEHRTLPNTYYIPRLTANIVDRGQLDEEDFEIPIGRGVMRVRDEQNRLLAKIRRGSGRPYVLDLTIARPYARPHAPARTHGAGTRGSATPTSPRRTRWARRTGSRSARAVPGGATATPASPASIDVLRSRTRRYDAPNTRSSSSTATSRGPITPATPSSNHYFLLLVDDYGRFMWVAPPGSKDAAPAAIRRIRAAAERKTGRKPLARLTAPYTPQQNGVVERRNQTVVAMARSMIKAKGLPGTFWGEAVNTAVYILNRTTTKGTGGKTPYELWNGTTPAVHHLRTFGCVAHVKNIGPNVKKLDDRSKPMIFVGYESGSKVYRVYDPSARRLHISRDVIFDEEARWEWDADTVANSDDEFVIEYTTVAHPEVTTTLQPRGWEDTSGPSTPAPTSHATPAPTVHATPAPTIVFASPPSGAQDDLDVEHDDDAPLRFRTIDNILGPRGRTSLWRKAMLDEMTSIEANGTWELVDPPLRQRPIGLKWVFKAKKDATGIVTKHKARLVAKGYVQRQGIDYDEVFAPVARLESVRLLLALAASEGWPVHHMDVKSAFLNGELREEVYVAQPPGFVVAGKEHKVLRLIKALYGLRQAPRAWYAKLDASLAALGFQRSASEHAVYTSGKGAHRLIVGVYVDDLIITGSNVTELKQFKEEMKSTFRMSDAGLLHYYLGLEVNRTMAGITIGQGAYATKILEAAGLAGCNASSTPMETRPRLSKFSPEPAVDATEYRRIVGALRYLVNTRPDLAFSVGYVSRFMEKPTTEHLVTVKRILRYVAGTVNYGCHYRRKEGEANLLGYSDSDHGADVDGRKSTSGVLFFLGRSIITWQSQKQKVVALSSCEAEYIAAATASCQAVWLARLLAELKGEEAGAVTLNIDNQSAIQLSKNPVFHDRSKHIDVKYHYIRECIEEGRVDVEPIDTKLQLADILTKALGRDQFIQLRSKLGLVDIKQVCKA